MSVQKNKANTVSFSKDFNPNEILNLTSHNSKMLWKNKKTKKDIVFRSPLLEVVYAPTRSPGASVKYSMALKVHIGENEETDLKNQEMFKALSESAQEKAIEFMMIEKNGQQYAKKTFSTKEEIKFNKFWYDNGTFYMKFRPSISSYLFNVEETKEQRKNGSNKKVYNPIRDDIRCHLGVKSLISVNFCPSAYFYNDKLCPFSLDIAEIVIWAANENKNPDVSQKTNKQHKFLTGFALDVPDGIKLPDEIKPQTVVPVKHVDTFDVENYSLSRVIDGTKGPVIYARDGDSFGPTYYKATNVVVKWNITPDPEWNTRSIVLEDCPENQLVLKMIREQYSKLVDVVFKNSEKILGEQYDRETVEEMLNNPLYSQKDSEKANARVSLKLPREEGDKPLFKLFILSDNDTNEELENGLKVITPINMGDTCDEAENYIGAGTVCRSLVFMTRPVIINTRVYLSSRVEQILVEPDRDRVFTPPLAGFSINDFVNITKDNFTFSKYDEKKRSFSIMFEGTNGKPTPYCMLPRITVEYDIGLVNDPDNQLFAYRVRYNHTSDNELLDTFRTIEKKTIEYCTEYSKDIFGATKPEKVVIASFGQGKLEKYSKKDKEKKEPYSTMKAPVYEKNGGYNIAFGAEREVRQLDDVGEPEYIPIELKQPDDLLEVFYSGATIIPVVRIRGTFIDKRIILSTTVAKVYIVSANTDEDIPFADADGEDMVALSFNAKENFEQNEVKNNNSSEEISNLEQNEVEDIPFVNSDEISNSPSKENESAESDNESEEEEEEESDDDE